MRHPGYHPVAGNSFFVVDAGQPSGGFTNFVGLDIGNGLELRPAVDGTGVKLVTAPANGPFVTSILPGGSINTNLSAVNVVFNRPILASSFTADDVTVTTPNSTLDGSLLGVSRSSDNVFEVTFPEQSIEGGYDIIVGTDITDLSGSAMPAEPFSAVITIDKTAPEIVEVDWADAPNVDHAEVRFSEPVSAATFTAADVSVIGPDGAVGISDVQQIDMTTFRVVFSPLAASGTYLGQFGPNIRDLAGNSLTAVAESEVVVSATAFEVTNTNPDGAGSLRQAILNANASIEDATIKFAIPDDDPGFVDVDSAMVGGDSMPDVFRIQPTAALPGLNNVNGRKIILNGDSQHSETGDTNEFGPEIEINGALTSFGANGLIVESDGVQINGLTIGGFLSRGITVFGDETVISNSFVGTDPTGSSANGNSHGIVIDGAAQVYIGPGNVVSGNSNEGIYVTNGSSDISIIGNMIGTDGVGSAAIANLLDGIHVDHGSTNIVVGGSSLGDRNIISGNGGDGIEFRHNSPTDNVVEGNYIGVNQDGNAQLGNTNHGVSANSGVDGLLIRNNVLSGNHHHGIHLGGVIDVVVSGNTVGLAADGVTDLGNTGAGISVESADDVMIGGTLDIHRNIISANRRGIQSWVTDNLQILNNYVGTDITGELDRGNGEFGHDSKGISIDRATNLVIGAPGAGNVISATTGNFGSGIGLGNSQFVTIQANRIGTNADGTAALPNNNAGIEIRPAKDVMIGGIQPGAGNVISGNDGTGIHLERVDRGEISGNLIGTTADGLNALGNDTGIALNSTSDIVIGGPVPEATNIISGSTRSGVSLFGWGHNANVNRNTLVESNLIGVDTSGNRPLPNGDHGILVHRTETAAIRDNVIGASGSHQINVIGREEDLRVSQWATADGGNGHYYALLAPRSFEEAQSIAVSLGGHLATLTSQAEADFVHTVYRDGNSPHRNDRLMIGLSDSAVEGTYEWVTGETFSFAAWDTNEPFGDQFHDYVHLETDGKWFTRQEIQHSYAVVEFDTMPDIGRLQNPYPDSRLEITGNRIGIGADGAALGNDANDGIGIWDFDDVLVGSIGDPEDANVIANSAGNGVQVTGDIASVTVTGNSIHSNGREGIDLASQGPTANDPRDTDSGPNGLQNFPELTTVVNTATETTINGVLNSSPHSAFDLHFYSDAAASAADAEGRTLIATTAVTTDGNGDAEFSVLLNNPLPQGTFVTATATDEHGNTSEFSAAIASLETLTLTIDLTEIRENGGTAIGTVTRSTTTGDLVVILSSDDEGEALTAATVTIPSGSNSATFTVTGVADSLVDGTQIVNLTAGADGFITAEAALDIADEDSARVSVTPDTHANEFTPQDGRFWVTLSTPAEDDITVHYDVSGTATADVDYEELSGQVTITAGMTSAFIDVGIIDDDIAEPRKGLRLTLAEISATGHVYADAAADTAELRFYDNDQAGFTLSTTAVNISEDRTSQDVAVRLTSQPTGNVVIAVTTSAADEVMLSTSLLTFTAANWNIAQIVTLTGVDDTALDGLQNADVDFSIVAADSAAEYRFLRPQSVAAANADNEVVAPVARLQSVTFYNQDAAAERRLSPERNGQRSIVKHIEVIFDGDVTVPLGAVTDHTFHLEQLGVGGGAANLTVKSAVITSGRTIVVLGFASRIGVHGSLVDGNYEFVVNGNTLGFDANGSGAAGGTSNTRFHRLFGDSDGDRDVDIRDYFNLMFAMRGVPTYRDAFDQDDDGNLFEERAAFFSPVRYGKYLNPFNS